MTFFTGAEASVVADPKGHRFAFTNAKRHRNFCSKQKFCTKLTKLLNSENHSESISGHCGDRGSRRDEEQSIPSSPWHQAGPAFSSLTFKMEKW
jgi:hypothetical protein